MAHRFALFMKRRRLFVLPALLVVGVALIGLLSPGAAVGTAGDSTSISAINALDPGRSPISYLKLPKSYVASGEMVFERNCASCHGVDGTGGVVGVNLVGVGPATADFWVSTGRMPLGNIDTQPVQKADRLSPTQTLQVAAFVGSLGVQGDYPKGIPVIDLKNTNLSNGFAMFVLNCAACHTITGSGDALADGYSAPTLHKATPTQAVEAIRTGPANMPHFGPDQLSDKQVADIVAYVTGPHDSIQHPNDAGGLGLGGIGPVAEGFIALFLGVGALMLVAFWIGDRTSND
jgi:ubiquinol-cytochrome c reductase cytochrome c subunit